MRLNVAVFVVRGVPSGVSPRAGNTEQERNGWKREIVNDNILSLLNNLQLSRLSLQLISS